MQETWRWFGPADPVTIDDVRQTGATGIVTALHHLPPGTVWPPEEIADRRRLVAGPPAAPKGLEWMVIESLPVSEDIKRQSGDWRAHVVAWQQSFRHLAAAGIEVVCYNFMPILDWTRTDLDWRLPTGASCSGSTSSTSPPSTSMSCSGPRPPIPSMSRKRPGAATPP